MERTIKTGSGRITIKTGSEGPRHDPYSYAEYTVSRNGAPVTVHIGLVAFVRCGAVRVDDLNPETAVELFEQHTGMTPAMIERADHKLRSRCPVCGGHDFRSEAGYPGEHFTVCSCGHVIANDFNESEIE